MGFSQENWRQSRGVVETSEQKEGKLGKGRDMSGRWAKGFTSGEGEIGLEVGGGSRAEKKRGLLLPPELGRGEIPERSSGRSEGDIREIEGGRGRGRAWKKEGLVKLHSWDIQWG